METEQHMRRALRRIRERHIGKDHELRLSKFVVRLAPTFRKAWFRASSIGHIESAAWILRHGVKLNHTDIVQTYWNARRQEQLNFVYWLLKIFPFELKRKRFQVELNLDALPNAVLVRIEQRKD